MLISAETKPPRHLPLKQRAFLCSVCLVALTTGMTGETRADQPQGSTSWAPHATIELLVPAPAEDPKTPNQLKLDSTRVGADITRHASPFQAWSDRAAFDAKVTGQALKLQLQGKLMDLGRQIGDPAAEFHFLHADRWETNKVSDTSFTVDAFGDRLRLLTRYARSGYRASEEFLQDYARKHKDKNNPGRERFLGRGQTARGDAFLQRIDAALVKAKDFGFSVFGMYSHVDEDFESLDITRKEKKKDVFAVANQETALAGATVRVGPVSVTGSQAEFRKIDHPRKGAESQQEMIVGLDVNDLRSRAGFGDGGGLWNALPSSIWASATRSRVDRLNGQQGPADAANSLGLGSSWQWSGRSGTGGYASVGYWRYFFESRQRWAEEYDWAGSGLDLNLGLYGTNWSADLYVSSNRSDDLAPLTRSTDKGYDASLSLSYRPANFPDLTGIMSVGQYNSNYQAYQGDTRYWGVTAMLGLDKFIADPARQNQPGLKLLYRYEGTTTRDSLGGSAHGDNDHVLAVAFRASF